MSKTSMNSSTHKRSIGVWSPIARMTAVAALCWSAGIAAADMFGPVPESGAQESLPHDDLVIRATPVPNAPPPPARVEFVPPPAVAAPQPSGSAMQRALAAHAQGTSPAPEAAQAPAQAAPAVVQPAAVAAQPAPVVAQTPFPVNNANYPPQLQLPAATPKTNAMTATVTLDSVAAKLEPVAASAPVQRRVALVIGNSSYISSPLPNPKNDATAMCGKLGRLGFETVCQTDVPTKRAMKDLVIEFTKRLAGGATALVYYAGHGLQVNGRNYLVPTQADLQTQADVEDETLSVDYLMRSLAEVDNPFNIFILDACRNNPLGRGWRSMETGGLAPIDAPSGSVILFATAPGDVAADGNGDNGLFTKHLLANIDKPGLSIEQMIKEVSRGVISESKSAFGKEQTPWWNSSFTGDFCFSDCAKKSDDEVRRLQEARAAFQAEQQKAQMEALERERIWMERIASEAQAKATAEARMKQLEAEIANSQAQKDYARAEEAKRLLAEQKTAYNSMLSQIEQLEQEKRDRELQLEEERKQRRLAEQRSAKAAAKKATVYVPPAF